VLDRRIAQMKSEGTRFRTGVDVGHDLTGTDLRKRFDAVVIAVGATVPRDLPVPGRELDGVMQAMDYLPPANRVALGQSVEGQVTAEGRHVVVIGGGDTGADCIGTAHRQGALSVTSLEIMPQPPVERGAAHPWPTYPMTFRVASAHEEGGERVYAVSTSELVGDEHGRVQALRLHEVRMGEAGFEKVEGSERELPAQLVLLAMGFLGPQQELLDQLGVARDERTNAARDAAFMTNVPGVFVAGDAGRGQSLIVWAIAEGRSVAHEVDAWLMGKPSRLPRPVNPTDRPLLV
jgi:glutamate synthase (NADPH/NADH) small chain